MLELYPYLKRVYEDQIVDCMMCREIAIRVSRYKDLWRLFSVQESGSLP